MVAAGVAASAKRVELVILLFARLLFHVLPLKGQELGLVGFFSRSHHPGQDETGAS